MKTEIVWFEDTEDRYTISITIGNKEYELSGNYTYEEAVEIKTILDAEIIREVYKIKADF